MNKEELCIDEGCPHFGTDHVCISTVLDNCKYCGKDIKDIRCGQGCHHEYVHDKDIFD